MTKRKDGNLVRIILLLIFTLIYGQVIQIRIIKSGFETCMRVAVQGWTSFSQSVGLDS